MSLRFFSVLSTDGSHWCIVLFCVHVSNSFIHFTTGGHLGRFPLFVHHEYNSATTSILIDVFWWTCVVVSARHVYLGVDLTAVVDSAVFRNGCTSLPSTSSYCASAPPHTWYFPSFWPFGGVCRSPCVVFEIVFALPYFVCLLAILIFSFTKCPSLLLSFLLGSAFLLCIYKDCIFLYVCPKYMCSGEDK